jgi:hypothetical protein
MATDQEKLDDLKAHIDQVSLTPEEKMELGIWLTGKGMAAAWTEAVEGLPD